jgi:MATE family multidrug resistance protein
MKDIAKQPIIETLKLAVPVSIGQIGHIMLGVTDSIMIGHVGATPLAAASLVNGLFFLILILGIGITLAITPLTSIAAGANRPEQGKKILANSIFLNSIAAVILFSLTYILADWVDFLNQAPQVAEHARSYAKILSFSILPFMAFQVYRQFIEGLSYTHPPMYISLAANFINIFGNWVLIYGRLGFPKMGLDGAGYSTFIVRLFMAAAIILYFNKAERFKIYIPKFNFDFLDGSTIKELLTIGIPSAFQHFFEMGAFSLSAIMIGWLGSKQLAAHQIALNLSSVTFMIILGVSAAGTIRVGNAYGRKDSRGMREAGFLAQKIAVFIMFLFGITFLIFRKKLPLIYINEPQVVSIASTLIIIAALFQISDGLQAVGLGILRSLKDVKIPMIISFVSYWIIALPLGYILAFIYKMDVIGIWIGLFSGLSAAAVFFTIRFFFLTKSID